MGHKESNQTNAEQVTFSVLVIFNFGHIASPLAIPSHTKSHFMENFSLTTLFVAFPWVETSTGPWGL